MLNFKIVYVCFMCLVITVFINSQETRAKSQFEKISEYFYYKCYSNSRNTRVFDKLYNDTIELVKYMDTATQFIPERRGYFCDNERKQLGNRIEQVSTDLTLCLPPEEKYLPEFLKTSFKEVLHFLCHNHGENIQRLFSAQGKTCTNNIDNDNSHELDNCFGKIFRPVSDKFITKKEVCDNMGVAQKCFDIVLEHKCPHAKSMHELNEQFFQKYVGKTCSSCVSYYISTLLFVVSIVVPYTVIN